MKLKTNMKLKTEDKIIAFFKKNKLVSAHNLTSFLNLSQRAVFKQLKCLSDRGLIGKIGRPPKVLYYLKTSPKTSPVPYKSVWQLLEKEDYANYLFVTAAWEGFTNWPKTWGFVNGHHLGAEYSNKSCNLFLPEFEYQKMNQVHFSMLFNQTKSWDRLHKLNLKNAVRMFSWARAKLLVAERNLSDKEIIVIIETFNKLQQAVHCPRGPMWLLETPFNLVSDYLRSYLEEQAQEIKHTKTKPYLAFQILSTSLTDSIWTQEEAELIRVCQITDKEKRLQKLKQHVAKYEWLEYGLEGKIMNLADFQERTNKILKKGPGLIVQKLAQEKQRVVKEQKRITREYQIDEKHQKIFSLVRDSIAARSYSKDSQFFGYYALEKIFQEFGRRTNLNLEQVRFLAPREFREVLLNKQDFKKITSQRMKYSLHLSDQGDTVFYCGAEAKKIRKKINLNLHKNNVPESKIISGQPAYGGIVKGRVKIVNTINEIFKIHQGNILVSRMTNPSIVPAMKKAAAIVTDIGGITCHAAIVARELRKPCIIGTKVATQVLRDGDEVEVNANQGEIRVLN